MNALARPFLKSAGGKRKLAARIASMLPEFGAYHEPFVGGGAVFFHLAAAGKLRAQDGRRPAYLGDASAPVACAWRGVRDHLDGTLARLSKLRNDEETYRIAVRRLNDGTYLAADVIYVNRVCFNGLWRVNREGRFNVPFGDYENPTICDSENLRACSDVLARFAHIEHEGFESVLLRARPGDAVYFDPPYASDDAPLHVAYCSGGFGESHQRRLRNVAVELAKRGVHVVLSNADVPLTRRLYSGAPFCVHEVEEPRSISCRGDRRAPVRTILVTCDG